MASHHEDTFECEVDIYVNHALDNTKRQQRRSQEECSHPYINIKGV